MTNSSLVEHSMIVVASAPTSIFAKQDVLDILTSLKCKINELEGFKQQEDTQESPKEAQELDLKDRTYSYSDLKMIYEELMNQIKDACDGLSTDDVMDSGTAQFSLSYNEVYLESVDINYSKIADEINFSLDLDSAIDSALVDVNLDWDGTKS